MRVAVSGVAHGADYVAVQFAAHDPDFPKAVEFVTVWLRVVPLEKQLAFAVTGERRWEPAAFAAQAMAVVLEMIGAAAKVMAVAAWRPHEAIRPY